MDRRTFLSSTLTTAAALSAPLPSWAGDTTDVAGVKFDNEIDLQGHRVVLNGAGVRYKVIFKVYAMGLYLPKKTTSADEAVNMPGAKRIYLHLLRDLAVSDFGRLVTHGIQLNAAKEDFVKIVPDIARIGQLFGGYDKAYAGDKLIMDWIPGTGMVARFKNTVQGEPFTQPEFFKTILKIWLGSSPPDAQLKELLLGHAPKQMNNPADALN
ncbi:chalcone isomerase family protein [Aquabacterium sp.]|uniref:chalcone isomerase family protein n=1 Tax=Aquabacterium sp. TaxID=1872578 RepID=UPI0035B4C7FE